MRFRLGQLKKVAAQGTVTAFLLQTIRNTVFSIAVASQVQQKHKTEYSSSSAQLSVHLKFKEVTVTIITGEKKKNWKGPLDVT